MSNRSMTAPGRELGDDFNNLSDMTHYGHSPDPYCDDRGLGVYPNHCNQSLGAPRTKVSNEEVVAQG